jgi:hypothetical protein
MMRCDLKTSSLGPRILMLALKNPPSVVSRAVQAHRLGKVNRFYNICDVSRSRSP